MKQPNPHGAVARKVSEIGRQNVRAKHAANRSFLSLHHATFRLGDTLVFENTSLVMRRHEQWAIVGGNASGKSLFADALCGRLPLISGRLQYHFRPAPGGTHQDAIARVAFRDRKQGLGDTVVQGRWNSMESEATLLVRDFLSFERVMDINAFEVTSGRELARQQFQRRLRRAVRLLDLERFTDSHVVSLSNGESQRLQLARALCHPVRLLILDEPFTGLDTAFRAHFKRILQNLASDSLKVLLITARRDDLPNSVTHVATVDQCRIVDIRPFSSTSLASPKTGELRSSSSKCPSKRLSSRRSPNSVPPTPPLIELRNVTVRYGTKTILDGLDWRVEPGESWALFGPNGSGKTTLLSLIAGDHPQAYANYVSVFGQTRGEGESVWELKKRIGSVSPELQLHFDESLTCFEAVASGFDDSIGLFRILSSREVKSTGRWLKKFGLHKQARLPLALLSAGSQRLVLLARALVKEPALLILDEPCQGLDAAHTRKFVRTVEQLIRSKAATVIYVTHREEEIPASITKTLRLA
jgi:molybdate transport system ATP-binding protein